jgi:hypothetical protein
VQLRPGAGIEVAIDHGSDAGDGHFGPWRGRDRKLRLSWRPPHARRLDYVSRAP